VYAATIQLQDAEGFALAEASLPKLVAPPRNSDWESGFLDLSPTVAQKAQTVVVKLVETRGRGGR